MAIPPDTTSESEVTTMSAFICGPDHIKALATFAVSGRQDFEPVSDNRLRYLLEQHGKLADAPPFFDDDQAKAELIANILHDENIRSVAARYREQPTYANGISTDNLPGLCERPE